MNDEMLKTIQEEVKKAMENQDGIQVSNDSILKDIKDELAFQNDMKLIEMLGSNHFNQRIDKETRRKGLQLESIMIDKLMKDIITRNKLLENDTLLEIATRQLTKELQDIYDSKGINIKLPPTRYWKDGSKYHITNEISIYIVEELTENITGAVVENHIKKIIKEEISNEINMTLEEYRYSDISQFKIGVVRLELEGRSKIEIMPTL